MRESSNELPIDSQTIQAIGHEYTIKRQQFKKIKLKWRSKKSLGWIPFCRQTVKVTEDEISYNDFTFRFWKHREILGKIKAGPFSQDSRGRWYVVDKRPHGDRKIGIDLGLKDKVTYSNGIKYNRENLTKKIEMSTPLTIFSISVAPCFSGGEDVTFTSMYLQVTILLYI